MEDKDAVSCPKCLSKVSMEADECPFCKVEFYNCSSCATVVLKDDKVCPNCNESLDEETVLAEE